MKYLFIVNPVSGGKRTDHKKVIAGIKKAMEGLSCGYEIYVTGGPMDAVEKIRKEAETGQELWVFACGGDGTLNECVNGCVGFENVSVTNYPCGTGNDFIKMFGEDGEKFEDLNALIRGEKRPIDLIKCNDRYGINICSVGIDARVGRDVHKYSELPVIGGKAAYVVSLVVNFFKGINKPMKIDCGGISEEGSYALVCACNGRFYGGGFNPVKDALPDDGILDILIVSRVSRPKLIKVVGLYAKGEYEKADGLVRRFRGEKLDIYGESEFFINVDGEAVYSKEVHINIVKKGVNFIFPKNMKFFNYDDNK